MSSFTTTSPAERIGKFKGEILAHAEPVEVLGKVGVQVHPEEQQPYRVDAPLSPVWRVATNENTKNRWVVDSAAHPERRQYAYR